MMKIFKEISNILLITNNSNNNNIKMEEAIVSLITEKIIIEPKYILNFEKQYINIVYFILLVMNIVLSIYF